jgi:hypothetical protein
MNLLPSDIVEEDILSPRDFLDEAVQEFSEKFRELKAEVVAHEFADRTVLGFVLRDIFAGSGTLLFEVSHLRDKHYPSAFSPPEEDLPSYLQRRRIPTDVTANAARYQPNGGVVENQWVCVTPKEFRMKLMEVFNLDTVKVRMLAAISLARKNAKKQAAAEASAS